MMHITEKIQKEFAGSKFAKNKKGGRRYRYPQQELFENLVSNRDPELQLGNTESSQRYVVSKRVKIAEPSWLKLVKGWKVNLELIEEHLEDLVIDEGLLTEVNNNHGLIKKYLESRFGEVPSSDDLGDLEFLLFLSPNIFQVSNQVVSDLRYQPTYKELKSSEDLDALYHSSYSSTWAENIRDSKQYLYISQIRFRAKRQNYIRPNRRGKLSEARFKRESNSRLSVEFKEKEFDWDRAFYEASDPIRFKLTRAEALIFTAFYIYRLEIEPRLRLPSRQRRVCRTCKRSFNILEETSWFNLVPPVLCNPCISLASNETLFAHEILGFTREQIKKQCIEGVKHFEKVWGFVPFQTISRQLLLDSVLSPKAHSVKQDELVVALGVLPRAETILAVFNSWAHFLDESGLLDRVRATQGGYQSIARDGHHCLSVGERVICEALSDARIKHSKEPLYPKDSLLNPLGRLRADFRVGHTYIEFAGRMSDASYRENIERKKKLARKLGLKVVFIENHDFSEIDKLILKFSNG